MIILFIVFSAIIGWAAYREGYNKGCDNTHEFIIDELMVALKNDPFQRQKVLQHFLNVICEEIGEENTYE